VSAPRLTAAVVCLGLALAACAGGGYSVPEPDALPKAPDTTAAQDFSSVVLAGVPGRTTTTVATIGPGSANLQGTVAGPDGPVNGAIVHLERIVDGGMAVADVRSNPDGTWKAANILGGRYRIRAFLAPELALVKPSVFFLGGTESKQLAITLQRYTGLVAAASIAPSPPLVDELANLVVRVATQTVDATGVVRAAGAPGAQVQLVGSGQWRVESANNPAITDEGGNVQWQVRCRSAGTQPLAVLVNNTDTLSLELPPCEDVVVAPPDTVVDSTSTSFPFRRSTTSTTRRTTTTSP
jgi:hypothetical protein